MKRVNIRGILANPDLRRELMIPTIQATQAREGIDTSREQAERAYYVVTEGESAAFFDLVKFRGMRRGETDRRHEMFVRSLADGVDRVRFDVARRDFGTIDGSPLAFRRIGLVAHIFRESPALEPGWGIAKQGLATAADERFVRHHWEVSSDAIGEDNSWVPFAKGGEFCRFYSDVYLVVNWTPATIKVMEGRGRVQNVDHYFKPGLTWPRAGGHFSMRWLQEGCIFADKGCVVLPNSQESTVYLAGILNSEIAEYLIKGLVSRESMGARWEVGVIKRLPIPGANIDQQSQIGGYSKKIFISKASWDEGNEISTHFGVPWLLRKDIIDTAISINGRLDQLAEFEATEATRIQNLYAELNDEVYMLYGITDVTRAIIEESMGDRPPEVLWPQMDGKSVEQKRMEHVFRLLSYAVKRVVEADEDGIVPFTPSGGESSLLDRVFQELQTLFPKHDIGRIEVEIANELKKNVKGYRSSSGIEEWLDNVFFEFHCSLYKKRPIFWHIASNQGTSRFAFGAICHYHKFDRNRMAKLRAQYLKDSIDEFRREAALADKDGRTEDRLEWQARFEETRELDRSLQLVQEGVHEGPEGGDRDFRILTPWKSKEERPEGWDPDLDDGVKVNIGPLRKAGVLRITKVV